MPLVGAASKTDEPGAIGIVEQRAPAEDAQIREVNTCIYAFRPVLLGPALRHVSRQLPGRVLPHRRDRALGGRVTASGPCVAPTTRAGVNDRWQLALTERERGTARFAAG